MQHWPTVVPKAGFNVVGQTRRAQIATMVLTENEKTGSQSSCHPASDQWLYVLAGNGCAVVNEESITLKPGAVLFIEAGETLKIRNTGKAPLETLNIYTPLVF